MITCILLSAGLSQRFGSVKALARLDNETIIGRLPKNLVDTQVSEIIVVLGAHAERIKPHLLDHKKVRVVYNKDYNFGQTSSFKAGLRQLSEEAEGILLLPVDYPLVKAETIEKLISTFVKKGPLITVPSYQGRKGHPPLFSSFLKSEFLNLDNESGLNEIARRHQEEALILSVDDPGVVKTFNTRQEFEKIVESK